jgi:cell division protein FtsI/penicillin-binding protein 2
MKRVQKVAILLAMSVLHSGTLAASSLLGPAVDSFLSGKASNSEISCVLSTTGGREVVYSRWADFNQPVPVGSLVKPFTALAYAASHGGRFPRIECTPESGCWLPSGHGAVGIEQAIGHSCNAYFRSLSEQLHARDLVPVTSRFGLTAPPLSSQPGSYFGLGGEWPLAPVALVRAYEELLRRSAEPAISRVLAGLKLAGGHGTASGVARALGGGSSFAKTGTAPCIHNEPSHRSNGDGYAVVLYPTDQPRYTLLVRVHGVPGREAANLAGEILKVVAGHPSP